MEDLTKEEILVINAMESPLYFGEIVDKTSLDSKLISDVIDKLVEKGIMREVN